MKFGKTHPSMSRKQLDEFVRNRGLRPYAVTKYKDRDIFLAETDLEHDNIVDYPFGYYQTAWFIAKENNEEEIDIGRWIEFDSMHNPEMNWSQETKRIARIETTIEDAKSWIDKARN